jgi:hypothetical protein
MSGRTSFTELVAAKKVALFLTLTRLEHHADALYRHFLHGVSPLSAFGIPAHYITQAVSAVGDFYKVAQRFPRPDAEDSLLLDGLGDLAEQLHIVVTRLEVVDLYADDLTEQMTEYSVWDSLRDTQTGNALTEAAYARDSVAIDLGHAAKAVDDLIDRLESESIAGL